MKNKKVLYGSLIGLLIAALGGAYYASNAGLFQGAFNLNSGKQAPATSQTSYPGRGPISNSGPFAGGTSVDSSADTEEAEEVVITPLMALRTDSSHTNESYDDFEVIGEWLITFDDNVASTGYLQFNLLDYSRGLYELSDVYEEVRLNVVSSDMEHGDQIDNNEYLSSTRRSDQGFFMLPGTDVDIVPGETRIFILHGKVRDDFVSDGSYSESETKVYLSETSVCGDAGDGVIREYKWIHNNTYGQNEYFFDDDNVGAGYGVPGAGSAGVL